MKPSNHLLALWIGDHFLLEILRTLSLLSFRFYVAWIFFTSGLTKIKSWTSTLYLFKEEYQVPLLSSEWAAYLGTAAELILPLLLALGLLTRLSALALFIFNVVGVIAYPYLWTIEGAGGFWQHVVWGSMLWVVFLFGPDRISLDVLLSKPAWLKKMA